MHKHLSAISLTWDTQRKRCGTVRSAFLRRSCSLRRQLCASLASVALGLALGHVPLTEAATLEVTTTTPAIVADGQCSLTEAIINANDDAQTHVDCPTGDGADRIILSGKTYTLTEPYEGVNGLPAITSAITIEGNHATIERDADADVPFRLFEVCEGGDLTLNETTVAGGLPTSTTPEPTSARAADKYEAEFGAFADEPRWRRRLFECN